VRVLALAQKMGGEVAQGTTLRFSVLRMLGLLTAELSTPERFAKLFSKLHA